MIPVNKAGRTLVPKPGNPNVMSVYQPATDFSDVIGQVVTPSFRPSPSGGVGGMDDDDDIPGLELPSQPPLSSSSSSSAKEGDYYGKRTRWEGDNTREPNDEGIFIPDALAGTPNDPFDMDALRRYTQRNLAVMHEPVVKFAASVGQKIGKDPELMLVNGGNLLDPQARNVQALFTTSPLSKASASASASVAQAIAQAVVELLKHNPSSETTQAKKAKTESAEPEEEATPFPLEIPNSNMKKEVVNPVEHALTGVYERIGVRNVFREAVRDMGRQPLPDPDPTANLPATSILRQLAVFLSEAKENDSTARWVWNSLPENSGIAIIRNDVVAAMEDCHAMVRKHIPDVQMWHLITGPHVRGPFAEMVAEYINRAPGELQFPNFQSTRGGNVLTGTRISAGKFREEKAVQRLRYLERWFSNVSYGPSEAWTYAQEQPGLARHQLGVARVQIVKWLEACEEDVTALWRQLITQPVALQGVDRYSDRIEDHARHRTTLQTAEAHRRVAELNYQKGLSDEVSAAELADRAALANAARQAVSAARQELEFAVTDLQRYANEGLRRRIGIAAEHVYALYNGLRTKDEPVIVSACNELHKAVGAIVSTGSSLYPEAEADTTLLLKLLTSVTSLKQAVVAVKQAQRAVVKAEQTVLTFPEASKWELFHKASAANPAITATLTSYLNPGAGLLASW